MAEGGHLRQTLPWANYHLDTALDLLLFIVLIDLYIFPFSNLYF